ncbi:MAG: transposase, partial [Dehalococcoidia bacterium]
MTRRSIAEYAGAVRGRYSRATKKAKTEILNEFVATTRMHRKSVIRLLNGRGKSPGKEKRGRPRLYGHEAMAALRLAWEASDCLCSRRLQPFLPELVTILKRCGELTVTEEIEAQLCRMSPSTIDRLLRRWRGSGTRRGLSTTKPGTLLKNSIPIRTFSDWNENKPGFLEADLVAHCGESTEGFYITTLSTVDVATGWCEPMAV